MKNKSLLTTFCGGLIGILLAGYAYYYTGKHYSGLVPLGVFMGCLIGYAIGHFKTILTRTKTTINARWQWLGMQLDKLPVINFSWRKFQGKISLCASKVWSAIVWFWFGCGHLLKFLYKKISVWLNAHPMNKVAIVEYALAVCNIGLVYYFGLLFNPFSNMENDSEIYAIGWVGVGLGYICAVIYPFAKKINA